MNRKLAKKWLRIGAGCVWAGLLAGCDSGDESETSLTLSPSAVYLAAGKVSVVTFTAAGGDGEYAWSLGETNLGEIYLADETAIYKSTTNAGINTISVSDGNGEVASAEITQE